MSFGRSDPRFERERQKWRDKQEITFHDGYLQLLIYLSGLKDTDVSKAAILLNKINMENQSKHNTKWYYELHATLWIFRNASYRQSNKYYLKSIEYNDETDKRNDESILYYLGKYNEALSLHIKSADRYGKIINLFHLEQYQKVRRHCERFKPFANKNLVKVVHNLVYALWIYCCIKTKKIDQARSLLSRCISYPDFEFNPIRAESASEDQVLDQNVDDATANLEERKIDVLEVYDYNPKMNRTTLKDYNLITRNLKEGQKVNLYQKDGKVRYYSVVDDSKTTLDNKETTETLRQHKEEMTKMQQELDANKEKMAAKDLEIEKLKKELTTIKRDQKGVQKLLKNQKLIDFLKDSDT